MADSVEYEIEALPHSEENDENGGTARSRMEGQPKITLRIKLPQALYRDI